MNDKETEQIFEEECSCGEIALWCSLHKENQRNKIISLVQSHMKWWVTDLIEEMKIKSFMNDSPASYKNQALNELLSALNDL